MGVADSATLWLGASPAEETQRARENKKERRGASSLERGRVPPSGFRASPAGGTTQRAGENKKERRGASSLGIGWGERSGEDLFPVAHL